MTLEDALRQHDFATMQYALERITYEELLASSAQRDEVVQACFDAAYDAGLSAKQAGILSQLDDMIAHETMQQVRLTLKYLRTMIVEVI
jgi:hypothetical protein